MMLDWLRHSQTSLFKLKVRVKVAFGQDWIQVLLYRM